MYVLQKFVFQVLQYNVPGGKKNRGLALVLAYRMLAKPQDVTPENIRLATIMGWCIEMVSFGKILYATFRF